MGQNLAALLDARVPDAELTYWHEQGRHEVDFVIEANRKVCAIEAQAASHWGARDRSGLRAFPDRTPQCVAVVHACNGREAVQVDGRLWALPVGHLVG